MVGNEGKDLKAVIILYVSNFLPDYILESHWLPKNGFRCLGSGPIKLGFLLCVDRRPDIIATREWYEMSRLFEDFYHLMSYLA